jgi:peptidoglycan/LPS O-acetylase OafA/YrhL
MSQIMHTENMDSAPIVNPKRSWARLDGVDLLRAMAIFFVLMNHVNIRLLLAKVPYTAGLPRQLVDSLIWNADDGVQIFFVVSGFLITSVAIRRWGSLARVNLREFYVLRFARIAPLLLSLLAVLTILHVAGVRDFVVPAARGGYWRALFAALTFHLNLSEAHWGYLPGNWDVLWSLSVEETFYLLFPIVCRLLRGGKYLIVLLVVLIVLGPFARTVFAHGRGELWTTRSYLSGMDAIAMGCLTAVILAWRPVSRRMAMIIGGIGVGLLVFILGFSVQAYQWGFVRIGMDMTVAELGTSLVIVWAAQICWHGPRVIGPLLLLGRRSYEIYLTHMFVVFALLHIFLAAGKPMMGVLPFFVGVILLAAVLGELVARFYSEPMNRWLRKRWGDGPDRLGSVVEVARETVQNERRVAV